MLVREEHMVKFREDRYLQKFMSDLDIARNSMFFFLTIKTRVLNIILTADARRLGMKSLEVPL